MAGSTSLGNGSMSLTDFPELPILRIATFLRPEDLLNFCHTCSSIYNILNKCSDLWKKALKNSDFETYEEIRDVAEDLVGSSTSSVANVDKLTYLMHMSTKKNWEESNFRLVAEFPSVAFDDQMYSQNSKRIVRFVEFNDLTIHKINYILLSGNRNCYS